MHVLKFSICPFIISAASLAFSADISSAIHDSTLYSDSTRIDASKKAEIQVLSEQVVYSGYILNQFISGNGKEEFISKFARLKLKGSLDKRFGYFLQVDVASTTILRDAALDVKIHRMLAIRLGQYKYRFGNYMSPWEWISISKPMVQTRLFDDHRDSGIQFSGTNPSFNYAISIINGTGRGVAEDDSKKSVVGTANIVPVKGLQLGGSFYIGTRNLKQADGSIYHSAEMNRFGGQIWFDADPYLLQTEIIKAKNGAENVEGYYAILGYKITPAIQPVFRSERYSAGRSSGKTTDKINALGVNFIFDEKCIIRVIHEWKKVNAVRSKSLIVQGGIAF